MLALFVFALSAAVALAQNTNACPGGLNSLGWCDCAPANSGIVIQQFYFSPNPPVPGKNITGSITAKLADFSSQDTYTTPVTGGSLSIAIQYMGIPLVSQTLDLCGVLAQAHQAIPSIPACPVPPTNLKQLQFNQFIPNSFPAGQYTGTANSTDQTGRVIQCVQFNWNLA